MCSAWFHKTVVGTLIVSAIGVTDATNLTDTTNPNHTVGLNHSWPAEIKNSGIGGDWCLEFGGDWNNIKLGDSVYMMPCKGTVDQAWSFPEPGKTGTIRLGYGRENACLQVWGGGCHSGVPIKVDPQCQSRYDQEGQWNELFTMPSSGDRGPINLAAPGCTHWGMYANFGAHIKVYDAVADPDWYFPSVQPPPHVIRSDILKMEYPTLTEEVVASKPDNLGQNFMCNPTGQTLPFSESKRTVSVMESNQHCFHFDTSTQIGASLEVAVTETISIPLIESTEMSTSDSTNWESGMEHGVENCKQIQTTTTRELTIPSVSLAPHTSVTYHITQWTGELYNLPFVASVRVHWSNGVEEIKDISGSYSGTSFLSKEEYYGDEHTSVTDCGYANLEDSSELVV